MSQNTPCPNNSNSEEFIKNFQKTKSHIFKFFRNPPLPPPIGPEEDSDEEENQHQITCNEKNSNHDLNLNLYSDLEKSDYKFEQEDGFLYDSIDYDLYEEGPVLSSRNYMNCSYTTDIIFDQCESGYNSPMSSNRSSFSYEYENSYDFDSLYSSDLVLTTNHYSNEMVYYYDDLMRKDSYKDSQEITEKINQETLKQPINFQSEKTTPKKESLISGLVKKNQKIIFLGVEKVDPAQYVAKYGPSLVNSKYSQSKKDLNIKPSVKFYRLTGQS